MVNPRKDNLNLRDQTLGNLTIMEIRITSQNPGPSSRYRQFIERKMRVSRRFIGDGVSAQIFLRRNAGVVPGKRFSAGARFTLPQGEILGYGGIAR
jgi:hypothetical protein